MTRGHGTFLPMRKPLILIACLLLAAGSGTAAWWKLRPAPPPTPAADEQSYKDIERPEYEKWMQDLGYTE